MTAPYSMNGAATKAPNSKPLETNLDYQTSQGTTKPKPKLSEKAEKQLVSWINSEYTKMKSYRQRIRRQWDVNLEMYGGNQYIAQLTGKNPNAPARIGTPPGPRHRKRSVTNRIRPIIRTEITKQTSQKPNLSVVPASGEDDDLFAAQSAESVWDFLYAHLKVKWTMERNAFWTSITGNGFIKTWWDPKKRDATFQDMYGMPTVGQVQIKPVTPYNLFLPDLLCEDIEDQIHVFEAYTKPVDWARNYWQMDFEPTVVAKTEIFEASYFQGNTGDSSQAPDSVLIIEAWIKPGTCKYIKEGGIITICGDKVVDFYPGIWYSHEEYPYAQTRHIPTGKAYGVSVLEDINSLQREYNETRSQTQEAKNRMARPQLLAPIGSFDITKYTSEPGLIIPYKPGLGKPEPLQIQPIPNYVLQEVERLISDMEDISGQHQVSRGMAPGQGVVAATAIAYLQEKDDAILSTTISSIEQALEKIGRHSLTLVVDYWQIPRIIRVSGTDMAFDSFVLKGSDISNCLDLRVDPGSGLPESKAARQAFLMDLANMGAISPQQMLDMMEIGGVQNLVDRMRLDMRSAQRENLKMKFLTPDGIAQYNQDMMIKAMRGDPGTFDPQRGIPVVDPANLTTYPPMVPVNKWDNHEVHITTHNNFRKSQAFQMLSPEVQDQFEKHIQIHESYVFMKQMNMGFGAAQQGAPPEMMGMVPEMDSSGASQNGGPPMGGNPLSGNPMGPGAATADMGAAAGAQAAMQ